MAYTTLPFRQDNLGGNYLLGGGSGSKKSSYTLALRTGNYNYSVRRLNDLAIEFKIEQIIRNFGETRKRDRHVKLVNVRIGARDTALASGSFYAQRSTFGLNSSDPAQEDHIENDSYLEVVVTWRFRAGTIGGFEFTISAPL